MIQNITKRYKM